MFREISRLRDVQDMKTKEALDQHDRMKGLEYDLQKNLVRTEDLNKGIEHRAYEIRNRGATLSD